MDAFNCVKPFVIWLRILGIFPVANKFFDLKNSKWQRVIHELPFYNAVIIASVLCLFNLKSNVWTNIWSISIFIGMSSFFVVVVYQRLKWNLMWIFLKKIDKIDLKVIWTQQFFEQSCWNFKFFQLSMISRINYRSHKNFSNFYSLFVFLLILVISFLIPACFIILSEATFNIIVPSFLFFQTYLLSFILQLTFAAFGVRERLRLLNCSLR